MHRVSGFTRRVDRTVGDTAVTMTLDEYRTHVLENLKVCTEAARVRELLGEVQTMLTWSRMSDSGQKAFWQSLNHDLNVLAHELNRPPEQSAGGALRAVIATAQAAIAQYQRKLKSDG
jgi:hypothetical protein